MSIDWTKYDNLAMLGAHWYYYEPIPYDYKYLKFIKGIGGHSQSASYLAVTFHTSQIVDIHTFLDSYVKEHAYTIGSILAFHGTDIYTLSITSNFWALYDYDLINAKKIDSFLDSIDLRITERPANLKADHTVFKNRPKRLYARFSNPKNPWISYTTRANCEQTIVAFSLPINKIVSGLEFNKRLEFLLNECDLDFGYYYISDYTYKVGVGNGRQGLKGRDRKFLDVIKFEKLLQELLFDPKSSKSFNFKELSSYEVINSPERVIIRIKESEMDFILPPIIKRDSKKEKTEEVLKEKIHKFIEKYKDKSPSETFSLMQQKTFLE